MFFLQTPCDWRHRADTSDRVTTLAIIRSLPSPNSSTRLQCSWGRSRSSHTFACVCVGVYTCTLCSCEDQRWGGGGSSRSGHNGVGVTFICTQKWCVPRPWTTQLDVVSVNTDTPPWHTNIDPHINAAEEETDLHLMMFSFFSSSFFSLSAVTKFIAFQWWSFFLKLQVLSFLVM